MRRWVVGVSSLLAACGDDGNAVRDAAMADADVCPGERALELTVGSYGSMGPIFPGEVCVDGGACVMPKAGKASLCVPVSADFAVRTNATGYEKTLWLFGPGAQSNLRIEAGNDSFVGMQYWTPLSVTYPPTTTGNLVVIVTALTATTTMSLEFATIGVTPSTGATVAYVDPTGHPDPSLTTTTAVGQWIAGDLAPGMVDVDVTSSGYPNCAGAFGGGWTSPTSGQVQRVPIIAGTTTVTVIECKP